MNREEAIEILKQRQCCMECVADCKCEDCDKAFEMAIKALENQKTGHWIKQDNKEQKMYGWYFCECCGAYIGEPTNYCSNCGAKMEGDRQ